jgi:hypothetical protein
MQQYKVQVIKEARLRVRRFGTWAHWSPLFESPKNSNFKALKKFKKNMWT